MRPNNAAGPPLTAAVLLILVAMSSLGLGYGLWSEGLSIEGRIRTGEVDATWLNPVCTEFHTWPEWPPPLDGQGEAEGKSVGSTTWEVSPGGEMLNLRIHNGYPSYAIHCSVFLRVTGSVPVVIRAISLAPGLGLDPDACDLQVSDDGSTSTLICPEVTVVYVDGLGSQLHRGGLSESSLLAHVNQPADENETYEFGLGVCLAQWNEGATAEECFAAAP